MNNVKVIEILPERWQEYKELRIKALAGSPNAFISSPEEELVFTDQQWMEKLNQANNFKVFAEVHSKLVAKMEVAWKQAKKVRHIAKLYGVYIDPEYRRQGIGEMLMDRVKKRAKEHEIEKIVLEVTVALQPAVGLYRKLGFREIGNMEKGMKIDGKYYDRLLMKKIL